MKKKMGRKLISIMLAFAMVLTGAAVAVLGVSDEAYATDNPDTYYAIGTYSDGTDNLEHLGNKLRTALKKHSKVIDIHVETADKELVEQLTSPKTTTIDKYKLLDDKLMMTACSYTGKPTEGDCLFWSLASAQKAKCEITSQNDYNVIDIEYCFSYITTLAQEKKLNSKIKTVVKSLKLSGKSDYKKTKKIYNYICANVSYDHEELKKEDPDPMAWSAYNAMFKHKAVCLGYSELFYRMAVQAGIHCRMMDGGSTDNFTDPSTYHEWNFVKLGEYCYFLDSTWDAGKKQANYKYFLKGTGDFYEDHTNNGIFLTMGQSPQYEFSQYNYNVNFIYRSQSAMLTTGGGPGGNDYPNYTSINGRNVYLDYDDEGSKLSVSIGDEKYLIAQTTDYSISQVVSNGTTFYYSVYNYDSGKNEFYEASTDQNSKKLYSTKKGIYIVGYYGGNLYCQLHKGNYYNKSKNRWVFKNDLIKMNVSTKKISTVKKGFNPQQSYGQYIICEKETDSYVNDFNARYIYNAATGKVTKLPVNGAYTIATPECVVSYQYSDGSIVRCDYNGKNKTVMLDNIDRALWIDDNKACVTLSEEDYLDGITYIFDYETGKLSRGSGIW